MSVSVAELDAEQRVSEGEKFLDRVRPRWRDGVWAIGTHGFTMADPELCIISKVEGRKFRQAMESLDITFNEAIGYGFLRSEQDPVTFYGDLHRCWARRAPR